MDRRRSFVTVSEDFSFSIKLFLIKIFQLRSVQLFPPPFVQANQIVTIIIHIIYPEIVSNFGANIAGISNDTPIMFNVEASTANFHFVKLTSLSHVSTCRSTKHHRQTLNLRRCSCRKPKVQPLRKMLFQKPFYPVTSHRVCPTKFVARGNKIVRSDNACAPRITILLFTYLLTCGSASIPFNNRGFFLFSLLRSRRRVGRYSVRQTSICMQPRASAAINFAILSWAKRYRVPARKRLRVCEALNEIATRRREGIGAVSAIETLRRVCRRDYQLPITLQAAHMQPYAPFTCRVVSNGIHARERRWTHIVSLKNVLHNLIRLPDDARRDAVNGDTFRRIVIHRRTLIV